MEPRTSAEEPLDELGSELAGRFLYHFVVRRYARALLGQADEWDGLPLTPAGGLPDYSEDGPTK